MKFISRIFWGLNNSGWLKWIPEKLHLTIIMMVVNKTFEIPNLKNPKTLTEKIQWLKLHQKNPLFTKMVDKYQAKNYISNIVGGKYTIPTIKVWDSVEDIVWEELPNKFILKCTHSTGNVFICRDKNNINFADWKVRIKKQLKRNLYYYALEWPYKNVVPRIICEPLLENKSGEELVDYKFYCYGGEIRYFMYSVGEAEHNVRNHKFNLSLESIDHYFKENPTLPLSEVKLPYNIHEMIDVASKLCKGFPFLRVDLFNVDGVIYVGELTFYSGAGFLNIYDKEYSEYLASLIDIESIKLNE